MKLKDILPYLDKMARVIIWDNHAFNEPQKDGSRAEEAYKGFVMDIPWIYMDFYLVNDENGEAIDARMYDENHIDCGFIFNIQEDEPDGKR